MRHLEMGKSRMRATLDGAKEIGFTIVSMTISLVAVFIPVVFMGGILGRLLREFAVTIIVAVLISGVVSLTLTPMLCSRMLADEHKRKHGRIYRWSERMFEALLGAYRWTLTWVLQHQRFTLLVFAAITVVHRRAVRRDVQGIPAGRRFGADPGVHRRRRRTSRSMRWRRCSARSPRSSSQSRGAGAMSSVGAGGPERVAQRRPDFRRADPARRASECRHRRPAVARTAFARAGHQGVCAEHPGDPHRRPVDQEFLPVHAARHRHD